MIDVKPIMYREFYDVPRIFVMRYNDLQLLFDCKFDESFEDYPNKYSVYVLPNISEEELKSSSWEHLSERAVRCLGEVAIGDVKFDSTKRKEVDVGSISIFIADATN